MLALPKHSPLQHIMISGNLHDGPVVILLHGILKDGRCMQQMERFKVFSPFSL